MASAAAQKPHNFIRILEALEYVIREAAVPSIENVIQNWHLQQIHVAGLQQCSRPLTCSTSGKPTQAVSCQNCVQWGDALENVYYPQPPSEPPGIAVPITWTNVNPTRLYGNYAEVASAFALHFGSGQKPARIADYDRASVLKIMLSCGEFHQSNRGTRTCPDPYKIIWKVVNIRNTISNISLQGDMHIEERTMKEYFRDITDLVSCLEELQHISKGKADEMEKILYKIQYYPVVISSEIQRAIDEALKGDAEVIQVRLVNSLEFIFKGKACSPTTLQTPSSALTSGWEGAMVKALPALPADKQSTHFDVTPRIPSQYTTKVTHDDIIDVIELLLPNDLQKVCFAFGLEAQKIYKAEWRLHQLHDDLRAREVLEWWRSEYRPKATRQALLDAVAKCTNVVTTIVLLEKWKMRESKGEEVKQCIHSILDEASSILCKGLDAEKILQSFRSTCVLSESDIDNIMHPLLREERVKRLLVEIRRRGVKAYDVLMKALAISCKDLHYRIQEIERKFLTESAYVEITHDDIIDVVALLHPVNLHKLCCTLGPKAQLIYKAEWRSHKLLANMRAREVLEWWRYEYGHEATRFALLEVLAKSTSTEVIVLLHEEWTLKETEMEDDKHTQSVLNEASQIIGTHLVSDENILQSLASVRILSDDDVRYIKQAKGNADRVSRLLDKIKCKGVKGYEELMKCLLKYHEGLYKRVREIEEKTKYTIESTEMEENKCIQSTLHEAAETLCQNLDPGESIIQRLASARVLSDDDVKYIKQPKGRAARVNRLLDEIKCRGVKGYGELMKSLAKHYEILYYGVSDSKSSGMEENKHIQKTLQEASHILCEHLDVGDSILERLTSAHVLSDDDVLDIKQSKRQTDRVMTLLDKIKCRGVKAYEELMKSVVKHYEAIYYGVEEIEKKMKYMSAAGAFPLQTSFHSEKIGPKGGQIKLESVGVTIDIPPQALDKMEEIQICLPPKNAGPPLDESNFLLVPTLQCKPDGLHFKKPVKLTISHSSVNVTAQDLQIMSKSDHKGGEWIVEFDGRSGYSKGVSEVTVTGCKIAIGITHFSFWSCVIRIISWPFVQAGRFFGWLLGSPNMPPPHATATVNMPPPHATGTAAANTSPHVTRTATPNMPPHPATRTATSNMPTPPATRTATSNTRQMRISMLTYIQSDLLASLTVSVRVYAVLGNHIRIVEEEERRRNHGIRTSIGTRREFPLQLNGNGLQISMRDIWDRNNRPVWQPSEDTKMISYQELQQGNADTNCTFHFTKRGEHLAGIDSIRGQWEALQAQQNSDGTSVDTSREEDFMWPPSVGTTSVGEDEDEGVAVTDIDCNRVILILTPADLQHLYVELGLTYPEISHAEASANSRDIFIQARHVLRRWRRNNGSRATRNAIIQALQRIRNQEAAEQLQEIWGL